MNRTNFRCVGTQKEQSFDCSFCDNFWSVLFGVYQKGIGCKSTGADHHDPDEFPHHRNESTRRKQACFTVNPADHVASG